MRRQHENEGKERIFGQGLPGTGGDVIRREGDGSTPSIRREDDVEGHLYTGGPTTQGDFAKRAPLDTPHGEQ